MLTQSRPDALRATILLLHEDGRLRSLRQIGDVLRMAGVAASGCAIYAVVRSLRHDGLIPARISAGSGPRPEMPVRPPERAAPKGEALSPWRIMTREHFAREARIRRWANRWAARNEAAFCDG